MGRKGRHWWSINFLSLNKVPLRGAKRLVDVGASSSSFTVQTPKVFLPSLFLSSHLQMDPPTPNTPPANEQRMRLHFFGPSLVSIFEVVKTKITNPPHFSRRNFKNPEPRIPGEIHLSMVRTSTRPIFGPKGQGLSCTMLHGQ